MWSPSATRSDTTPDALAHTCSGPRRTPAGSSSPRSRPRPGNAESTSSTVAAFPPQRLVDGSPPRRLVAWIRETSVGRRTREHGVICTHVAALGSDVFYVPDVGQYPDDERWEISRSAIRTLETA